MSVTNSAPPPYTHGELRAATKAFREDWDRENPLGPEHAHQKNWFVQVGQDESFLLLIPSYDRAVKFYRDATRAGFPAKWPQS